MKPDLKDERLLLAWAIGLIEREQKSNAYGRVEIHLEDGKITRAKVERSEKPPAPPGG